MPHANIRHVKANESWEEPNMRNILFLALVGFLVAGTQSSAQAGGHEAKIKAYLDQHVASWLASAELQQAVYQQNLDHKGLTDADISVLDQRWRAEKSVGGGSLMSSKMSGDLAAFLRGIKAASGGVITEIFVMDEKGLNVAQTDPTGDYMQGDEAKWKKTFGVGPNAILIGDVEQDGGLNVSQASLTISRENGFTLGAVTIGINVDALK